MGEPPALLLSCPLGDVAKPESPPPEGALEGQNPHWRSELRGALGPEVADGGADEAEASGLFPCPGSSRLGVLC